MKRKQHSTEQIISILKEHEAGLPVSEILRKHSIHIRTASQFL